MKEYTMIALMTLLVKYPYLTFEFKFSEGVMGEVPEGVDNLFTLVVLNTETRYRYEKKWTLEFHTQGVLPYQNLINQVLKDLEAAKVIYKT